MTKKITDLDPALPLTGAEVTPLVQNAVTRRSTLSALADWVLKTYAGYLPAGTGAVATTVKNYLDSTMQKNQQDRVNRNLRALVDAAYSSSILPNNVMLQKLRSDYSEFAVFTPITPDGVEWARWLFSTRFNVGLSGSTRMVLATLAKLYQSSTTVAYTANNSTLTQAQAPTVTQGTAAATSRTGTWVGPATVGGVTDVIYSVTTGDKVVYSLTGVSRIALRAYTNLTNGGYAAVVVKDSGGVEVSSDYYTVPIVDGYRRANYRNQQNASGIQYITVANGLPSGNYTVEVAVAADNPASGRLYDAGVFGYAAIAFNSAGQQGIFTDSVVGAATFRCAFYPGARVTYPFTGTKIAYRHGVGSNAGKYTARVYSAGGVEIASDKYLISANTVDAYSSATTSVATTPIASGLVNGSYFLVIEALPEKNASSSAWRFFDYGITSYNESVAGVVGTDAFDLLGVATNYQTSSDVPTGTMLIGYGNLEQAISVRRTTDANGIEEFVGGIHGHETAMDGLAFKVGGAAIDYAGAAVGATFIGSDVQVDFSTSLKFVDDASNWASSVFSYSLSSYGYTAKVVRTITADAVIYKDYSLMLPVASGSSGTWAAKGVGGAFSNFAVEGSDNYTGVNVSNDASIAIDGPCLGVVAFNRTYAVTGFNTNTAYRNGYEAAEFLLTDYLALIQDRSDGVGKFYSIAFKSGSTGRLITAGDTQTRTNVYRCLKGFVGGIVA